MRSRLGMAAHVAEKRLLASGASQDGASGQRRVRLWRSKERAKAKVSVRGRSAVERWTKDDGDADLSRKFGSRAAQRALFGTMARLFQPAMAFGFGDLVFELRPNGDAADPAASD